MSGSEDDFASADEGESEPDGIQRSTEGLAAVSVKPAKEGVIKDVASRSVTTSEASGHSKGDPAAGNVGDTHKQSSGGNSKKRRQKKVSAQKKGSEISVASIEAVVTSECVEKVENDKLEADVVQKTTDIEVTHKVYEAPLSISDLKQTTDSSEELTKPPSTPEKRVPDHDSSENLDNTAHANHEAEAAAMAKSPSSQDIPRSKPDHTTQQEEVLDSLTDAVKDNQKKIQVDATYLNMSGSEDDFASADEGESEPDGIQRSTEGLAAVSVKPAKEGVIKDVASRSVTTSEASGHSKGDPAAGNVGDTHKQSSGGNSKKRRQKKVSAQKKGSEISVASIEAVVTSECVEKVENDKLEADVVQKTTDIEVTHKVYEAPLSISDLKQTTDSSEELTKPPSTPEKRVPDHDSSENLDNTAHANHEAEAAAMAMSPSSQDIPRSKPDHTTQQEEVLDSLADAVKDNQKKSGWGWGWGSSLLDVASTSVSTFKSQVGEGFSTVMETVESTLKLPSPEEMAASRGDVIPGMDLGDSKEPQPDTEESVSDDTNATKELVSGDSLTDNKTENPVTEERSRNPSGGNWFSTWGVSNITSAVQHTVTGGLDVLETLGKKTFDVIKDHDPGLKKTKGLLFERGDKQNLSQMLRDAKEQSDAQTQLDHETEEARKAHFGSLFDDFQGLAHLEALEILSNQSERKLNSLLTALGSDTIAEIKPRLLQIKGHFEMDEEGETDVEEQDFVKLVTDILGDLAVGTTPDKLVQTQKQAQQSMDGFKIGLESDEKPIPKEMHRVAISSLAELTSRSMEQFHKVGELILLHCSQPTDFVTCSGHLASLTKVLCSEVGIMSAGFTQCLNKCADGEEASSVNTLVTNVYLEAANSSSYIQDGFQLLLPVLQQAAVENTQGGS